jgi:hypothetical protein
MWDFKKVPLSQLWPYSSTPTHKTLFQHPETQENGNVNMWSDNKVHKFTTVCLPWQHWTKPLVWFDDDISAFHSCVVVDLWQSLSERHLLLSACVLVCCRENVGA